ncbi:type II secretion system F family protein [Tautonia marina]|uniref:type II secretion system F family protein n=1 Tax=Tautonia marina TaxID=2653855 RepID=UPI001260A529|nr:type II secretion system F family protein [Tautonia marina]
MNTSSSQESSERNPLPAGLIPGDEPGRPLPTSRSMTLRDAMLVIVVVAVLVRLAMPAGLGVVILLLVVVVLAGVAGGVAMLVRGRSIGSEPMLRVVSNAVERGLPLEPGIEACGALCGGGMQRRSRAVVALMERGVPIGEAFARVPGSFPRQGIVSLRMGWDGPVLGQALRSLGQRQSARQPFHAHIRARLTYLIWTLLVMQVVITFLMFWVGPKIEAISIDFGVELPAITRWTFALAHHPAVGPTVAALVLLQLVGLPLLAFTAFDPMDWGFTLVDRLLIKRHGATVLRALAGEVALNRPMPEALDRIAQAHTSRLVRQRLRWVAARVARGQSWTQSLTTAGLIRPNDGAVLDAASGAGNLAWALEHQANGLDRRVGYRVIVWSQILYPVAIIALAVPVVLFMLTYFLPLVTIIRAMAS